MFLLEENKNNRITLTRGDDAAFRMLPNWKDGKEYELHQGDVLEMVCRKKYTEPVAFRVVSDRTGTLRISHSDTSGLNTGYYIYDITLTMADGKVNTIVNGATLELVREVK